MAKRTRYQYGRVEINKRITGPYVGKQFLRVPMLPQGSLLYLQQLIETGAARHFRAAARLSLLPALAAAAFVNLRITGDDKGIW